MKKENVVFWLGIAFVVIAFAIMGFSPIKGSVWELVLIFICLIILVFLLRKLKDNKE